MSRSAYLEAMILTDWRGLFRAFAEGKDLATIVVELGCSPDRVREAFAEYSAGLYGKPAPEPPEVTRARLARDASLARKDQAYRMAEAREVEAAAALERERIRRDAQKHRHETDLAETRTKENTKRVAIAAGRKIHGAS